MSRILWLSNAPWCGSGYGEQTALFTSRFRDAGHDVGIAANFGIQGGNGAWGGMPVFACNHDWGNPAISTFYRFFQADMVISLCDSFVLKPDQWDKELRMGVWAPIDHYPIPPPILAVLQHPKVIPIAMSRFGEHWMRNFKLDPLYAPHGVDTSIFKPQPELRAEAREKLKVPADAFLVGMVAANRGWSRHAIRKSFPQAFDAFASFARKRKDAYLYVHSMAQPDSPAGIDLAILAEIVQCPKDRIMFQESHAWDLGLMDNRFVADAMQAFDVLLNPSMSEGFGIPILEAQACGVPVITSDHSAMTELTAAGWMVDGERWWHDSLSAFAFMPSIKSIEEKLELAYEAREDQALRARAVEFAQTYDADRVMDLYWKPVLERLLAPREIPPLKISANGGNRAQRRKAAKAKARA